MNSSQANGSIDHSDGALIDWSTPEMVNNKTYSGDYINNPFDKMELEAANMGPFDLVPIQIPLRKEPPCENMLSPSWEPEFMQIERSLSFTDVDGITNDLKQNYKELLKDDIVRNQSKDDDVMVSIDRDIVDQSIEVYVSTVENKLIDNQESKIKEICLPDHNIVNIEQIPFCTEEEKSQIREQTQQRIQMLIEKAKKDYEEKYSQKPLSYTMFKSSEWSLNKTENVLNKGFIQDKIDSNSNSLNNTGSTKTYDNAIDINDNSPSNVDSLILYHELNSMDLDSLKPEWVVDSFSDNESLTEIQSKNKSVTVVGSACSSQIDITSTEAVNCTESVETKQIECQTVVLTKHIQNKRPLNKGPFLANIPLQHMVKNYEEVEAKKISHAPDNSPRNRIRPVATSTPTIDTSTICVTPSSDSPITKNRNFSRRSTSASNSNTPLNITKCIRRSSSNTEIALSNIDMNKSILQSKITKIQKPVVLKMNKLSSLPVLKKCAPFQGKENIKPQ